MNLQFLSKSHKEMAFRFAQKLVIKKREKKELKKDYSNQKSSQFTIALEITLSHTNINFSTELPNDSSPSHKS